MKKLEDTNSYLIFTVKVTANQNNPMLIKSNSDIKNIPFILL